MKDQTRLTNHLIQENIQPYLPTEGKKDTATLYAISEKIKRLMTQWIDRVGIEEVQRVSLMRKPSSSSNAKELLKSYIDKNNNLDKLGDIYSFIEDGEQQKAWNKIFS